MNSQKFDILCVYMVISVIEFVCACAPVCVGGRGGVEGDVCKKERK